MPAKNPCQDCGGPILGISHQRRRCHACRELHRDAQRDLGVAAIERLLADVEQQARYQRVKAQRVEVF